jgi:hypothetical protein
VSWNGGRSVAARDSSASIDQSMRATLPINVARLDLIPVTAELVPLHSPEARVQFGGLTSPQNNRAASGVESNAIRTLHRGVA